MLILTPLFLGKGYQVRFHFNYPLKRNQRILENLCLNFGMADGSRLLFFPFAPFLIFFGFLLFFLLSFLKDFIYLEFHILVVSPFPENAAASRANGKGGSPFINKRSNQILGSFLGQLFERSVTFDAARIRPYFWPEFKLIQNLLQLRIPIFTFYEKGFDIPRFFNQSVISAEKDSSLFLGQLQESGIFYFAEIDGVKPENFKPFG
jgi:hypothetical protein